MDIPIILKQLLDNTSLPDLIQFLDWLDENPDIFNDILDYLNQNRPTDLNEWITH